MLGFLRWAFEGCLKQVQFWALVLVLLAVLAQLAGCPDPIPWYMSLTGVAVSVLNLLYGMISYQYWVYKREQERIVTELTRK